MNCPRCNATFFTSPVISRKDSHTKICSYCGLIEDLEATSMKAPYHGPQYSTVDHPPGEGTARPIPRSDIPVPLPASRQAEARRKLRLSKLNCSPECYQHLPPFVTVGHGSTPCSLDLPTPGFRANLPWPRAADLPQPGPLQAALGRRSASASPRALANAPAIVAPLFLSFDLARNVAVSVDLPVKKLLTLKAAKAIAAAAEVEANKGGSTVVIAIVDDGGHLLLLERLDNTQVASVDVGKARTASIFRRPRKDFEDQIKNGRAARRYPFQAGTPILVDGKVIGAIPRRIVKGRYLLRHSGILRLVTCAASTNKKRSRELPCLVICPSRHLSPLESSKGTNPK